MRGLHPKISPQLRKDLYVRWGHYILLYAVSGDGFLYQDPAARPIEEGRARRISRDQLDRAG